MSEYGNSPSYPVETQSETSMNFRSSQQADPSTKCFEFKGESWISISHSEMMDEFFMMPLSSSDHWMFISSRGTITAGRRNEDRALFPYYSSDKLIDTANSSGPRTIIWVKKTNGEDVLWEPWSSQTNASPAVSRNLFKNALGNKLAFEEQHLELGLSLRYTWTFGNQYGFLRDCRLTNLGDTPLQIRLLDGIQNVIPAGVDSKFQMRFSNLADAYKRSERLDGSDLGIYYLSSVPTDRAEPSEGLQTSTVWQTGLDHPKIFLSDRQLDRFRQGGSVESERESRGLRGSYFVVSDFELEPGTQADSRDMDLFSESTPSRKCWTIVADVYQSQSDVVCLRDEISNSSSIREKISTDVLANQQRLNEIASACDAHQQGAQNLRLLRHQSNVLFNLMRGGMPPHGYQVTRKDFEQHIRCFNRQAWQSNAAFFATMDDPVSLSDLLEKVESLKDPTMTRLTSEHLPFTFSRRHGDPTRPWNRFSIDFVDDDGTERLCYQGNWRDIFQNWEALCLSFPDFAPSMVLRFVNASTADGYNPYRVTQDGIEWEKLDPEDPWANIGYWGDHQIIYLDKLLEWTLRFTPTRLNHLLAEPICAYTQIPYRIRSYQEIKKSPQETIDFDNSLADEIEQRVKRIGSDGKLLHQSNGHIVQVTLAEKLLVPILIKLTNFVPEGGLWLNTQRPEWNDANNALVGNGLSVVTVCYMRRYLTTLIDWLGKLNPSDRVGISCEIVELVSDVADILKRHQHDFESPLDAAKRKEIVDALSNAGCSYRHALYQKGLSGEKRDVSFGELLQLFRDARRMVDHTIRANQRNDNLFHSYNLMCMSDDGVHVGNLFEMLEGQVAVLSSGLLSGQETCEVLQALRSSKMYREDQQSYLLYPDRDLPRFLEKNVIPYDRADLPQVLQELITEENDEILLSDSHGDLRFNSSFRNAQDLNAAMDELRSDDRYADLLERERGKVLSIYEETFQHARFTGRSGTFFAYEGLGSIYWHMVSKLALATLENCLLVQGDHDQEETFDTLRQWYREIREGLGLNKPLNQYGAFTTDAYSHTPKHAGAQQPGMTGQVKEDVICRMMELGVVISDGQLAFKPELFETSELLSEDSHFDYVNLDGQEVKLPLSKGCFAFTFCQTPVIYRANKQPQMMVYRADGTSDARKDPILSPEESQSIFAREAKIDLIEVHIPIE